MTTPQPCRYCGGGLLVLRCTDGKRRTFDPQPVAVTGDNLRTVWAWRRGRGMECGEPATGAVFPAEGLGLHYCAERQHFLHGAGRRG